MTLFWAMSASREAAHASADATAAHSRARTAAEQVKDMESRLDRSLLACEAMWSLLRERLQLSDQELADRINEIDLQDGELDGKVARTALECPKCRRRNSPRFRRCMYCGQALERDPFA